MDVQWIIEYWSHSFHYLPGQHAIVPLAGKGNYVFGLGGKLNWQSAREKCWELGMDLAIVESEEANLLVMDASTGMTKTGKGRLVCFRLVMLIE